MADAIAAKLTGDRTYGSTRTAVCLVGGGAGAGSVADGLYARTFADAVITDSALAALSAAHPAVTFLTGRIHAGTGAAIVALWNVRAGLSVASRIREIHTTTNPGGNTLALTRLRGLDTFGGLIVTGTTSKSATLCV